MKILVACMGNVLRGDDGFGIRVAEILSKRKFADGVYIYEAGIGGIGLIHELMSGYDALILVDAIDKSAEPGTLFVVQPMVNQKEVDGLSLHESLVDMHYADPSKVLILAKALNVCPPKVFLVGCQPEYVDDAVEGLRPPVERAVPVAVKEIVSLINELSETNPILSLPTSSR
ncbi:MAG: hydrogenase maturation protease [Pyrinomonadaceae bacterium]